MKNLTIALLLFCCTSTLYAQSTLEQQFQNVLDSIYQAHPEAIGIMVHVEAPEKNISWSGASGYSDQNSKSKLSPDQPALIASSIKTYVAATILSLVEEGKITIDQAIEKLISPKSKTLFEKDGYDLKSIQIQHLLSHTSGIEDYANKEYIEHKDKNPMYRWTREEQLKLATEVGDPLGKAGEQFSYADANYLLLTEIIENATQLPFYDAMRQLLKYEELDIQNTWFPTLEDKPSGTKELVHQYWGEKNWDSYKMDVSWDLYGGGGIACPTKDLALFVNHFFNGKIVKDKAIQNLIFTYIPTKETAQNPYYLGLSESTYHGMKAYGHGGFWGTVMMHFPAINTSISVYILDRDARKLRKNVLDALSKIMLNEYSDRLNAYASTKESSEIEQITATLIDYIEGSTNGQPNRLKKAFHPDLNLYYIKEGNLKIWSGEAYIEDTKEGIPTGEVGKIINIDYENDIAVAKVQISHPKSKTPYIDYFMLTKIMGKWTIVHKMFTKRVNE